VYAVVSYSTFGWAMFLTFCAGTCFGMYVMAIFQVGARKGDED